MESQKIAKNIDIINYSLWNKTSKMSMVTN